MAIRYIPDDEIRGDGTFVCNSANDFCDGMDVRLSLVGWTQLSGTRAGGYLRSTLFGIGDNQNFIINGQGFHCGSGSVPGGYVPFTFTGLNDPATYINFAQAINSTPSCGFRAVQAGEMTSVTTDGPAGTGAGDIRGVDIESTTLGPTDNGAVLSPAANNATMWFSYGGTSDITDLGGYRLQSKRTDENLHCRALIYVSGVTAQFKVASADETYVSASFTPTATGGIIYRVLSNPYQFYALTPGATSSFLYGGTPALPTFLKGLLITSVSNTNPIQVTTAGDHNLVTGEQVFIGDALEQVPVTSVEDAPLYGSLTLIRPYRSQIVTGGHEWVDGDVVTISAVTGATGVNGTWKIREADATTFVTENSHNDTAYVSGGQIIGPRNSTNGLWTVTVINDTTFTLDTSDGTNAGLYIADSGHCGKVNNNFRQIARCIFMTGTGSGNSFRTSMFHAQTLAVALNASEYTGGDNTGSPRMIYPGLIGKALLWSNDCAILCEPYMTLGINGLASEARIVGQPWDCALVTQDYTNEVPATFDTHNWLKVTGTTSGSLQWGSLWFVTS